MRTSSFRKVAGANGCSGAGNEINLATSDTTLEVDEEGEAEVEDEDVAAAAFSVGVSKRDVAIAHKTRTAAKR